MNSNRVALLALAAACLFGAGCGSLDVTPPGDPDRVLNGTVKAGEALPAGTEIVVRLLASLAPEPARVPAGDLPVATRPTAMAAERLLGEFTQTLTAATNDPVPFTIPFHADDAVLRRGVNVEARVSVGGRVRYRTINAHVVTLNSARFPQEVAVQPVGR